MPDALANKVRHPRNVYLRQDAFEADVNGWLTTPVFAPHRLCDTIDQMIAGQQATGDEAAAEAAAARIADANLKMTRYRAALDAGGDPEEIGKWITDAEAQRLQAEAELRQAATRTTLTRQQIKALIESARTSPPTCATPSPATWQAPTASWACGSPTTQNGNSCAQQHGLLRRFRTAELVLFHAVRCRFRYSSWASCGVL